MVLKSLGLVFGYFLFFLKSLYVLFEMLKFLRRLKFLPDKFCMGKSTLQIIFRGILLVFGSSMVHFVQNRVGRYWSFVIGLLNLGWFFLLSVIETLGPQWRRMCCSLLIRIKGEFFGRLTFFAVLWCIWLEKNRLKYYYDPCTFILVLFKSLSYQISNFSLYTFIKISKTVPTAFSLWLL